MNPHLTTLSEFAIASIIFPLIYACISPASNTTAYPGFKLTWFINNVNKYPTSLFKGLFFNEKLQFWGHSNFDST